MSLSKGGALIVLVPAKIVTGKFLTRGPSAMNVKIVSALTSGVMLKVFLSVPLQISGEQGIAAGIPPCRAFSFPFSLTIKATTSSHRLLVVLHSQARRGFGPHTPPPEWLLADIFTVSGPFSVNRWDKVIFGWQFGLLMFRVTFNGSVIDVVPVIVLVQANLWAAGVPDGAPG